MRFRDHMMPGGCLEWSHFQCNTCKAVFAGYAAFSDHVSAKNCKSPKAKVNSILVQSRRLSNGD